MNGGMDGDWQEGQRPEARGPVVLRVAAAVVAGRNGDGGGGGGDFGGGEGDGGRLRPHLIPHLLRHLCVGIDISFIVVVALIGSNSGHSTTARQRQDICYCTCDLVMIVVTV